MPRVQANGIELEYEEFGDADAPVFLLIMGLANQLVGWPEDFCQQLAATGRRVIRFDNRDVGLSSRMDHFGLPRVWPMFPRYAMGLPVRPPYSLSDMAADAAGLLDALGIEQADVAGASMGGMITQLLAIEHPHKVRSFTSIFSTTGSRRLPWPRPFALRAILRTPPTERDARIEFGVNLYRTLHGTGGLPYEPDLIRERISRSWERNRDSTGSVRQFTAVLGATDRTEALGQVQIPAAVVHGNNDPLVNIGHGRATAAALPNAKLTVIDGLGHGLPRAAWDAIQGAMLEAADRA